MKHLQVTLLIITGLICFFHPPGIAAPKIDPIRFSISTTATQVSINEEFEIEIKADLLNIPANTLYIFEGARAFRLKMILPAGFQQTGRRSKTEPKMRKPQELR
jgi:hypothetical protein